MLCRLEISTSRSTPSQLLPSSCRLLVPVCFTLLLWRKILKYRRFTGITKFHLRLSISICFFTTGDSAKFPVLKLFQLWFLPYPQMILSLLSRDSLCFSSKLLKGQCNHLFQSFGTRFDLQPLWFFLLHHICWVCGHLWVVKASIHHTHNSIKWPLNLQCYRSKEHFHGEKWPPLSNHSVQYWFQN